MNNSQRAKQFASGFDPLAGYKEALEEIQRVYIPQGELSEDQKEQLNYTLSSLHPGTMITVIFYKNGEYLKTTGMLAKIDTALKNITVVDKVIGFEDIYDIVTE